MAVRNKLRYYMLFLYSIARSNLTKWPVKLLGAYRPDKNSAIAKNGNGNPKKRRNFDIDISDIKCCSQVEIIATIVIIVTEI